MFEQQLRRVSKYYGWSFLFIVTIFFSFENQFFVSPPRLSPLSRVTSNIVRTRDMNIVYANKSRYICSSVREGADINNDIVGIVKFLKRGKNHNNIQQTTRVVHAPTETYYTELKKRVHNLYGKRG